ncbi:MAG: 5-deoxy-glucuronate isomerase [Pseudomonadota bacterium]
MSPLLRKPISTWGHVHALTPATAKEDCPNWDYVGFDLYRLKAGETLSVGTGSREHLLVIIEGKMTAAAGGTALGELGARMDIFSKEKAHALYVPNDSGWDVVAVTDLELAVCSAPGKGGHPVRVIEPDTIPMEERGKGANTRLVNAICMEEKDWADSLLVTEVWTPNGNWSSYPSHKHDQDNFPTESYLEETYYHRLKPGDGWGVQRVFTDDLGLNETMAVYDRDLVLVPEGYHPCAAPYGYEMYYLNVMAGPLRKWRFQNDPRVDWLFRRDGGKMPGEN